MDAQQIIKTLGLVPLEIEGGYFRETYRSSKKLNASAIGDEYSSERSVSTAIYYLLTPDTFSEIHRIKSDEIFHFYAGDTVEMLQLFPDGTHKVEKIGNKLEDNEVPQLIVPAGLWQGCRLVDGGKFALLGTTVAPGFDYEDYERANRQEMIKKYMVCSGMIEKLTKK